MAGSSFSYWGISHERKNFPLRLAKSIGYEGDEADKSVLEFLRDVDPRLIIKNQGKILTLQVRGKYIGSQRY